MASNTIPDMREIERQYQEESSGAKLARKTKEAPYMPIGIVSAILGVGYGALKFRSRGNMSPSIYFIHMRVAAQGTVVAALTLGIGYSLLRDYVWDREAYQKKLDEE